MFASGIFVLLQPVALIVAPEYINLIWIIQICSNLLMIFAILQLSNPNIFKLRK
jgi:hypothetical protein